MIEAILLDDKSEDLQRLLSLIHKYSSLIKVNTFLDLDSCKDYLKTHTIDVIFLDIEIEDRYSFEITDMLEGNHIQTLIVYVTNYPRYAAKCVGYKAIKFINKNELDSEIEDTLRKIESFFKNKHLQFHFKYKNNDMFIPLTDISHFLREENMIRITYSNNKGNYSSLLLNMTISQIETKLNDYFIKVDRGVLVNIQHILEMKKDLIIMKNQTHLPISRRRRKDVLEQYHIFKIKNELL